MPEQLKNLNWKMLMVVALIAMGAWAAWKFLAGKASDYLDVKDVRVGLYNWAVCGIMAITFILVAKYLTAKFPVPGVTEAVHAV